MPYGLSLFTLGMCEDYFEGGSETLGELVRVAKCKLIATDENPSEYRQTIETIGRGFSPKPELLVAERREHADLIHLLGDPLLRIKRPEKLGLVSEIDEQNGTIQLTGRAPFAGKAKIAISFKRNRFRVRPPRRSVYNPNEFESYQETYEQVQQLSCSEETKEFAAGDFNVAIAIPESAQGECVVQVYLQGETGFAIDSVPVLIER